MADPPAAEPSADSIMPPAKALTNETTETNCAETAGIMNIADATFTSQALAQSLNEREALPTTTTAIGASPVDDSTGQWPRLHLLALPRELRDQIYHYAIVSEDPYELYVWFGRVTGEWFCDAMPGLTQASRQLRLETRLMFLEENTLRIMASDLLVGLSAKPFDMLKALCTGAELQNVEVDCWGMELVVDQRLEGGLCVSFFVTKTDSGLKVEGMKASKWENELYSNGRYVPCYCRMQRLASWHDGQESTIFQFLGALRDDWVARSRNVCDYEFQGLETDHEHNPTAGLFLTHYCVATGLMPHRDMAW